MKKNSLGIIVVLLLVGWQLRPIFSTGFFPMHDDTQVARVVVMGRALRDGQFPVRWVSDLGYGYGYPIFNFYGPLPYYVGGLLYALGFSGITATKFMFASGIVAAALAAFLVGKKQSGVSGGILIAVVYSYMSYHAVQIYVRGAIGEYWATIWLPLILLGVLQLKAKLGGRLWLAGGIVGVVLSHTLLGLFTVLAVALYLSLQTIVDLIRKKPLSSLWNNWVGLLIGIASSAFFWLPAMAEKSFTAVSQQISTTANFRDHFLCLSQLWYSNWGFGGSIPGCVDGLSFSVGKIFLVLAAVGLLGLVTRIALPKMKYLLITGIVLVIVSIFLMLPVSQPIWELNQNFAYLQYPWRLLNYVMLGLALLSLGIVFLTKKKVVRWSIVSLVVLVTVWQQQALFQPQFLYQQSASAFETTYELRYRASKVSDEYLPSAFIRPDNQQEIALQLIPNSPNYQTKIVTDKSTVKKYEFESVVPSEVVLAQAHFPGWRYYINSQPQQEVRDGKPVLSLPQGFSTLEMKFYNTPIRTIANLISLAIVIVLLYVYGKKTIR